MLSKRLGDEFVANCTKCGRDFETGTGDFSAARQAIKDAGWKTVPGVGGEWEHYCENCA